MVSIKDRKILRQMFSHYDYVMTTAQLSKEKLYYRDIQRMLKAGLIEKVKRGYYHWTMGSGKGDVVIISRLFPDGILYMETALFYYGYSDRNPAEWNIAIDKNASRQRTRIDYPSIKAYRLEPALLSTVIEVVRSNMAQKGTITVSKSGEVFSSVNEAGGLYQPVYAVRGLEGAVYEITAAEDIYTLDGTLRASKGEVVDTVTTGADGTAVSKELYLGKYEVKEITAPFGMVLNEEIHAVELVYAGQNVAVTETAASFYNERQRVEIDLIKRLMTDEAYGIGKNGEIFDVTFGLYAEKELTAADGTVIPADGLIEIISLDGNGSGKVKTDLPIGSYYVKELATNSAYILNGQKYSVAFEYAGQETATVHITANGGEAIENDIIYGSVSGKKSDEDGNALGGAVIGIFKTGTEKFTTENAIQTTVTAADGSFSFEKVPYG